MDGSLILTVVLDLANHSDYDWYLSAQPIIAQIAQARSGSLKNEHSPQATWANSIVNHPDDRIQLHLYFFRSHALTQETAEYPDPTR